MKRKARTFICWTLIGALLLSPLNLYAEESNEEKLEQIQQRIQELTEQIENYSGEIAGLLDAIAELDNEIDSLALEITRINGQIEETNQKLLETEAELRDAEEAREEHKTIADKRMRVMYMYGNMSYLEVLFSADSITDLFSRIDAVRFLTKSDNSIFSELLRIEAEIEEKKEAIEGQKASLEQYQTDLSSAKATLEESQNEKNAKLNTLYATREGAEDLLAQEKEDEAAVKQAIAREQNPGVTYDNVKGEYLWPCPGYYTITSPYGYRIHPISGAYSLHTGTDIGAPYNANIIAPGDGRVILAQYYGGYGNCVILDMGDGVSMLFAHCNELWVSYGQQVSAGQTIALVGSTGNSTGAHLHFEVLVNGQYTEPLEWVQY